MYKEVIHIHTMNTPKQVNCNIPSGKLDGKDLKSYIERVKDSFWGSFNNALSLRDNYLIWAVEVQGISKRQAGSIFGLKKSASYSAYQSAKNRKEEITKP